MISKTSVPDANMLSQEKERAHTIQIKKKNRTSTHKLNDKTYHDMV